MLSLVSSGLRNEMSKSLVIVESPAKAKTISKYLGKDFTVEASVGHIKDLPKNRIGVDLSDGSFAPELIVIPGKEKVVDRLKKKHAASAAHLPAPVIERRDGATIGVITIGSCDLAVREALDQLADAGVPADFLRVRGFPFVEEVRAFVDEHELCFVVEQNRDAQLRSLIAIETGVSTESMHPVLAYGGFPLSAQHVVESVLAKLEH